ncbi:hypothetical protein BDW74DRAFT_177938 [Aspergillus multicolor]|uniref:uncharacterized protein n=1 Tax=Aspergillus multicolor TaxID=41759 RepID=UPI003CCD0715
MVLLNELLQNIIQHLPTERDIYALIRANKKLFGAAKHLLYEHNAKENNSDCLIWAAKEGEVETILYAVSVGRANVNTAICPNKEAAEQGADVNARDFNHRTPLMIAVWHRWASMVRLLLSRPDIELNCDEGLYGMSPLSIACYNIKMDIDRVLIINGPGSSRREFDLAEQKVAARNTLICSYAIVGLLITPERGNVDVEEIGSPNSLLRRAEHTLAESRLTPI